MMGRMKTKYSTGEQLPEERIFYLCGKGGYSQECGHCEREGCKYAPTNLNFHRRKNNGS